MTIERIGVISIPVSDQQKAKAFYVEKLGFTVVADNPFMGDQKWIEVAPPGAQTTATLVTWFPQMPPGSLQGVVLMTNNLDADHAALAANGVEVTPIESAPWGRYTTFNDPDGNGWVLQGP